MDRLETELQHMLKMLAPPFFNGWKDEIWAKAERLDATDPDFAGLLNRIKAEVKARGWHKASSVQPQSSSSSGQPAGQPGTETTAPTPARTSTTARKAPTGGQRSSSQGGL